MKRRLLCSLCIAMLVFGVSATPALAATEIPAQAQPLPPLPEAGSPKVVPQQLPEEYRVAVEGDDDLPGVSRNWWMGSQYDDLTAVTDEVDVYPIFLEQNEWYAFSLNSDPLDFDIALFDPAGNLVAVSDSASGYEYLTGIAGEEGYWFITAWTLVYESGPYNLNGYSGSRDDDIYEIHWGAYAPDLNAMSEWIWLDSHSEWDDIRRVYLRPGDEITFALAVDTANSSPGFAPQLRLWGPGDTRVRTDTPDVVVTGGYPQVLEYDVATPGWYAIDVWHPESYAHEYGWALFQWSGDLNLVYRFYNPKNGTHFFTATEAEKANVIANLIHIYQYEGPAYRIDPAMNADPIWRFYKPSTGTHFYTADPVEKDRVQATMAGMYTYEGPAYEVSRTSGPGYMPVWRFFRPSTGTHLYTADPNEANTINTTLRHLYSLDGIAFYVGTGY